MVNVQVVPRQIVRTKFLGPTDHRPARVKATTISGKSVTLSWDHALNMDENHARAAQSLIEQMNEIGGGWSGNWTGGNDGNGYVFVNNGS